MSEILGLRDELAYFAIEMERKLRANDHKTGWRGLAFPHLLKRLHQETAELERALNATDDPDYRRIVTEAADVANFAMMIANNAQDEIENLAAFTRERGGR